MARNQQPDRIESAGQITLVVSRGDQGDGDAGFIEIPISRLDTTKEVEINQVRESSLKANGYSITAISYSGSMMFKGSRVTKSFPDSEQGGETDVPISEFLYDDHGVPVPFSINITHDINGEPERYQTCLVNSEQYEVREESETETAFDWVAMDRASDQPN
jgi:hypothetical protein